MIGMEKYLAVAGAWGLWCFFHSFLISHRVTIRARDVLGERFAYYRIFYNGLSLATLAPVLFFQAAQPEVLLLSWAGPWRIVQALLWGGAIFLFIAGIRVYDLSYFLGTRQVREYLAEKTPRPMLFASSGILNHVRHPWYSAAILIIWGFGDITDIRLLVKIILTLYILIGVRLEEAKLIQEIGPDYREYCKKVPMLIPRLSSASPDSDRGSGLDKRRTGE